MPYGTPRTDSEREARHFAKYGVTELPPRGTGFPASFNAPDPILIAVTVIAGVIGLVVGLIIKNSAN